MRNNAANMILFLETLTINTFNSKQDANIEGNLTTKANLVQPKRCQVMLLKKELNMWLFGAG
jgi:hypothetical protein